jgi:hypothetical protein
VKSIRKEETCDESWQCEAWSKCSEGKQTRNCVDFNNCGTKVNKSAIEQSCRSSADGKIIYLVIVGAVIIALLILFVVLRKKKKPLSLKPNNPVKPYSLLRPNINPGSVRRI